MVFRIQPHTRLHEWVADEAGFFRDEGLEYDFDTDRYAAGSAMTGPVTQADEMHGQIRSGALEDMAKGRSSDVSCACHWAVNAAAAARHGRMYGKAYSVCPSGIFVPADSPYRQPAELAGVEVAVGLRTLPTGEAVQPTRHPRFRPRRVASRHLPAQHLDRVTPAG
jgi:NitT/TauT family transport system substrate-binding protein